MSMGKAASGFWILSGFGPGGRETENQEAYVMRRGFWETQRWDFGSAMVVQMA